ncbi:dynamin family protein [Cryptosporangium aurantiacum]|uniref:Dynamin family protein n=1 Tax=Cryptosporangium aurantiacum TaxID=134849 RepID=A0A1M7NR73_9ACTN|nr:dynamin family protein [Cryptosporangium aurantiacum]SHN06474.1 Dynamin family protein [Cryptosporangium aurantiacum]
MDGPRLADALEALRASVARVRLGLAVVDAEGARRSQSELVGQVDDYLLPRLRQLDAPMLVAVGGSTGAGKSTLVNTLVGAEVTKAGWLRPTTRAPVLVCHPDDVGWFETDRILPGLSRTTGRPSGSGSGPDADAGARTLQLVPHDAVPQGLALLDPPDIDSVVAENRDLAGQLLAAADLWIFVTTAARYADAVPWDLLHTAAQRTTALAIVLNRVPPEGVKEIGDHLRSMLAAEHLGDTAVFAIPEVELEAERIPDAQIAQLGIWLDDLAADADARDAVIRTTLTGALTSLHDRVTGLSDQLDQQLRTAGELRGQAAERYEAAVDAVDEGVRSGTVLRGEVLARWQEFVGTGQFTRNLEAKIGALRDRVTAFFTGRPPAAEAVEHAVEGNLHALVRAASDRAAEQTTELWRSSPAGRALIRDELRRSSAEFGPRLEHEIRAWQERVLDLVRDEGGHRRSVARLTSFGVNGAGLVLMLAVFAQTAGLTGLEVVVAGGTSAVSQKVLEAIFGDAAVRTLAARARDDLLTTVETLLDDEQQRFSERVDAVAPTADETTALRDALAEFETALRSYLRQPGLVR